MHEAYALVIDDNADARTILSQIIQASGVRSVEVQDGEEAMSHILEQPPAVIFLDLMMPRMDGFSVLTWVRSQAKLRQIPIVVVSACDSVQLNALRQVPGVKHVIQKASFQIDEVQHLVHNLVQTPG